MAPDQGAQPVGRDCRRPEGEDATLPGPQLSTYPEGMSTTPGASAPSRVDSPPAKPSNPADEHLGFNDRVGAIVTRDVSSMWSVYLTLVVVLGWIALATFGPLHKVDPYPFPFLL